MFWMIRKEDVEWRIGEGAKRVRIKKKKKKKKKIQEQSRERRRRAVLAEQQERHG
jgi:hypothetical protein